MVQEQYEKLEAEAAAFFADAQADRAETKATQKEALRTFGRDGWWPRHLSVPSSH